MHTQDYVALIHLYSLYDLEKYLFGSWSGICFTKTFSPKPTTQSRMLARPLRFTKSILNSRKMDYSKKSSRIFITKAGKQTGSPSLDNSQRHGPGQVPLLGYPVLYFTVHRDLEHHQRLLGPMLRQPTLPAAPSPEEQPMLLHHKQA